MKKEVGMIIIGAVYFNSKSKTEGTSKSRKRVEALPEINLKYPVFH